MQRPYRKTLLLLAALFATVSLGGCIVEPYPRYAYGPGYDHPYWHPHYWWR